MVRLTLSDMRARCTDFFFSPNTRRFYRGARTTARYDRKTDQNYIRVEHHGNDSFYKFNVETGKTNPIREEDNPFR